MNKEDKASDGFAIQAGTKIDAFVDKINNFTKPQDNG